MVPPWTRMPLTSLAGDIRFEKHKHWRLAPEPWGYQPSTVIDGFSWGDLWRFFFGRFMRIFFAVPWIQRSHLWLLDFYRTWPHSSVALSLAFYQRSFSAFGQWCGRFCWIFMGFHPDSVLMSRVTCHMCSFREEMRCSVCSFHLGSCAGGWHLSWHGTFALPGCSSTVWLGTPTHGSWMSSHGHAGKNPSRSG